MLSYQPPDDYAGALNYATFQARWAHVDFPPQLRRHLIIDEEMRTCLLDAALPHLNGPARRRFLATLERGLLDGRRRAWLGALQQLEHGALATRAQSTTTFRRGARAPRL